MTKTQTFYDYQVQTVNKINATNFISKNNINKKLKKKIKIYMFKNVP